MSSFATPSPAKGDQDSGSVRSQSGSDSVAKVAATGVRMTWLPATSRPGGSCGTTRCPASSGDRIRPRVPLTVPLTARFGSSGRFGREPVPRGPRRRPRGSNSIAT